MFVRFALLSVNFDDITRNTENGYNSYFRMYYDNTYSRHARVFSKEGNPPFCFWAFELKEI